MILYWAFPRDGAGHAVRAAAICRWLENDVVVLRGIDDPDINKSLDHFGIPYEVVENRHNAVRWAMERKGMMLVLDDRVGTPLDYQASLSIWRVGRPERPLRPLPRVRIEGPGALWPVLMLDDSEILSKEEARDELGLPQDEPIIIGIPSTCRPGLIEESKPDYMLTRWPALRWMRAADHIVGAPGANLYGEVNYLGIPATWIKAPQARDQIQRLFNPLENTPVPGAARQIAKMIDDMHGSLR